jgi:ATP-binding cassette subfamily G (WHITE) protein 2 (SNQ2)
MILLSFSDVSFGLLCLSVVCTDLFVLSAGRKTEGRITGELLINGRPVDQYFPRISGYVEQFNALEPTQTIREGRVLSKCARILLL